MEVEQLANARSNVLDDLIALAQGFVETLTKEDFTQAEAQFTQTMQQALPLEQLQQTWQALIAQVGPLKTQAGAQHEKIGQYDRIVVRCEFARAPLQVRIVFNADRQIAGLFFTPVQEDAAYIPPSSACRWALSPFQQSCWCMAPVPMIVMKPLGSSNPSVTWPGDWPRATWLCCAMRNARKLMPGRWPPNGNA